MRNGVKDRRSPGDYVEVETIADSVFVTCYEFGRAAGSEAQIELSPKRARRFARMLKRAAKEARR